MMNRRKVWKGRHRRNKRIRSPKLKSQLNQSPPMVKAAGKCPLISASLSMKIVSNKYLPTNEG